MSATAKRTGPARRDAGRRDASIKDVAKLARVSIATVSRFINAAQNLRPDTTARVAEAIAKLRYRPNRIARSLSGSPFRAIGVAAGRSSNPFFIPLVLKAIEEVTEAFDYEIFFNSTLDAETESARCLSMVEGKVVQGFLLLGSRMKDPLVDRLHRLGVPFVLLGRVDDAELAAGTHTVDTDNLGDSREAVRYLIGLGHRRIACIHSPLDYVGSKDRFDGYIRAHKEEALPVDYSLVADGGYTIDDAYRAARAVLLAAEPPTALFATDDFKALGVYKAILERNLSIPRDISIIGHNNYDFAQVIAPPLSTIEVPIEELGRRSATMLVDLIGGRTVERRVVLQTRLIARESCRRL